MKRVSLLLSLPPFLSAGCFGATVAEMSGTVFTLNTGARTSSGSQPVVLYFAIALLIAYVVLRQRRRA
jgi:hypothetical protein